MLTIRYRRFLAYRYRKSYRNNLAIVIVYRLVNTMRSDIRHLSQRFEAAIRYAMRYAIRYGDIVVILLRYGLYGRLGQTCTAATIASTIILPHYHKGRQHY